MTSRNKERDRERDKQKIPAINPSHAIFYAPPTTTAAWFLRQRDQTRPGHKKLKEREEHTVLFFSKSTSIFVYMSRHFFPSNLLPFHSVSITQVLSLFLSFTDLCVSGWVSLYSANVLCSMLAVRARCLAMFISLLCLVTVHLLRLPGVTRRPFYRYCRLYNCMLSP